MNTAPQKTAANGGSGNGQPPNDPDPPASATPADRTLSGGLMALAGGIFAAVLSQGFGSVAELTGPISLLVYALIVIGGLSLGFSIFFGGTGSIYKHRPGPRHPFNLQALTLIFGTAMLALALSISVFSQERDAQNVIDRLTVLETETTALRTEQAEAQARLLEQVEALRADLAAAEVARLEEAETQTPDETVTDP